MGTIRYTSFEDFYTRNENNFKLVQGARKIMKSPEQLALSGNALGEARDLTFMYLNLKSLISELLFGLSGSVLDAKHNIKTQKGLAYREMTGAVKAKEVEVEANENVIKANEQYDELNDLLEYLNNKAEDFSTCYYYYRDMNQRS